MKSTVSTLLFAVILTTGPLSSPAQTNTAQTPAITDDQKQKATLDKHLKPILSALNLQDQTKEDTVSKVFSEFLAAHTAWHETNDATLKQYWNDFNQARSKQDKAEAGKALAEIDGLYATFKPVHDKFISGLATVLTPEQITTVEDVLTVNKVKVTYNVYLEIFPTLTDTQKAVVLKDLENAREQAIDAGSMNEKSAFFKKYKIVIEDDYLTAQGYDPKQARKDFAAKSKSANSNQ